METKQIYSIGRASYGIEQMDYGQDIIIMFDGSLFRRSYLFTDPIKEGDKVVLDDTYEFIGWTKPPDTVRINMGD